MLVVPAVAYLSTAATLREIGPLLRRRTPYLMAAAALIALVATTPAIILDAGTVADFLALQAQLYGRGRGNEQSAGILFNARSLVAGMGPVTTILGVVGCVAIVAGRHRRELSPCRPSSSCTSSSRRSRRPISSATWCPSSRIWRWPPGCSSSARSHGSAGSAVLRRVSNAGLAAGLLMLIVLVEGLVPDAVLAYQEGSRLERPDTRTLALDWILANVPRNTVVARERYTPQLTSARYRLRDHEFLWQRDWRWYEEQGVRYLITGGTTYGQFYRNARPGAQTPFTPSCSSCRRSSGPTPVRTRPVRPSASSRCRRDCRSRTDGFLEPRASRLRPPPDPE